MAMGKRRPRQEELFIPTADLTPSAGHPFYQALNRLLDEAGFDRWVEARCAPCYAQAEKRGQPSLPPGVYFRMLLVGYFEGIDSQRGIAWRCSDSLSLRAFLGIPLGRGTPDHSTLTNTRKRLPAEVFTEVFEFVLGIAAAKKLIAGKTVGVDSTTLEASAAMKSIVRRDTGEDWKGYVTRLMREEGVIGPADQPSDEDVRRFDKKRKDKTASNAEWQSATDPDARIAHMKDGTTHLAYKAEHVVDLASDLVLAAEIRPADHGDAATLVDSVAAAQIHLQAAGSNATIKEAAADKGYHAASTIELSDSLDVRTYIPEPKRKHRLKMSNKSGAERQAIRNNRRRMRRAKGKALQRRRSEVVERTFAHICETGGSRRSHLRGLVNVTKRYLIAAAAHNLGRILRRLTGMGKPRCLQGGGRLAALAQALLRRLGRAPKSWVAQLGPGSARCRRCEQFQVVRLATWSVV
ncbi:MAG TPA: transposase [Candidatus Polarisedimenticolia bacterium]|jgi:transposase|nr:transposase [Candidatus Polarisedimenticolia bacterium]